MNGRRYRRREGGIPDGGGPLWGIDDGPAKLGRVIEMSAEDFEGLVERALDEIPEELAAMINNVVIMVDDDAPEDAPGLLGLYEGTPITERDEWYSGVLPDTIRLFRAPILDACSTYEEVVDEVLITVVHEVAHYFGIDDARLHELGWG